MKGVVNGGLQKSSKVIKKMRQECEVSKVFLKNYHHILLCLTSPAKPMQLLKKRCFSSMTNSKDTKRLSETDSNFSLQSTKLTYFSRCFWLWYVWKMFVCWYHLTSICWPLLIHICFALLKTAQRTSSKKCENFPRQDFVGQRGISPEDIQKSWHQ